MSWQSIFWQVPLGSRPHLSQMAVAMHGRMPVECFLLPRLWCLHIYRYEAEVIIDGKTFPIRPGYASVIPPGKTLEYRYQDKSVHCYTHFALPKPGSASISIPAMQDLGKDFAGMEIEAEPGLG